MMVVAHTTIVTYPRSRVQWVGPFHYVLWYLSRLASPRTRGGAAVNKGEARMRIGIGGLLHETSTFSRVPTTLGDFMRTQLEGEEILERRAGTKSALGGYIHAGRDFAFEAVPTFWAATAPGGTVTAEALITLTDKLVAGIKQAQARGGIDGILLDFHGAMVAENADDAESYTYCM